MTHPCTPTSAREDTYSAVLDRIRLYSCRSYSHSALEYSLHETVFPAPRLMHSARRLTGKSFLDTSYTLPTHTLAHAAHVHAHVHVHV